jgi:protein gp37
MSDNTAISWTDATWNCLYGCSKVSAGCRRCYAIDVVGSLPRKFKGTNPKAFEFYSGLVENGNWTGVVKLHEEHLTQPLRWQKPRRIFVNSLSDLFHESVPSGDIARIFAVMALASRHTFQVLTKRPKRMTEVLSSEWFWCAALGHLREAQEKGFPVPEGLLDARPVPGGVVHLLRDSRRLPNVWLGVSVENQAAADERIPLLLRTPATVRFLSCEPLLGPVDLQRFMPEQVLSHCPEVEEFGDKACEGCPGPSPECPGVYVQRGGVDWVIAGGESGPNFRAMDPRWAESLRDQCVAAKVAFFFKQHSARKAGQEPWLRDKEGRCFRWHQFPGDLAEPEPVDP